MPILKAEKNFLVINYLAYLHLFSCLKITHLYTSFTRVLRHAQIDGKTEEQG